MSQARDLPQLKSASVRNLSARPVARTLGHHSFSEANLSRRPSLPTRGDGSAARVPSRGPASQQRGRLAVARPSTTGGIDIYERPPLPRPSSQGSVRLGSKNSVSSRRSSVASIAGSELLSRRGSLSTASVCSSSIRSKVELSFKPSLFISSADQPRDPHPGGHAIGKHPRKLPLKSFQGSLGESWGAFSWHRPFSGRAPCGSRASTRASSRCSQSGCSQSSLLTAGLEVLQLSTPTPRSDEQEQEQFDDRKDTDSDPSSRSDSPVHSPEPPPLSPQALADKQAAAEWADMEKPLASGALFVTISLSEPGYEARPLAVLARSDFTELNSTDHDECTALHQAARKGLLMLCSSLLDCPDFEEANAVDRMGRTALHCAAAAGHADVCSLLLEHPRFSDADATNMTGCTALHSAACAGSVPVCRTLLEHPSFTVSALQDCDGETALHYAAWNGHALTCQLLLDHPGFAASNVRDRQGRTPLHSAAMHGWTEACCAIWKHPSFEGAEAEAHDGSTACEAALKSGQYSTHSVLQKLMQFPVASAAGQE